MSGKDVAIVNLGSGNLHSVRKAVEHVGGNCKVRITDQVDAITSADHLILPGQGAIGTWFRQLCHQPELHKAVNARLRDGPVLGICLGLQALYEFSQENGGVKGLGILDGQVRHFSANAQNRSGQEQQDGSHQSVRKIPHMGWNNVTQRQEHPLWDGISDQERFYFVHSYYVDGTNRDQTTGTCCYGNTFTAAAGMENIFATQFHPEKSQLAGLRLLKNFINWNGDL